jgi:RNA polymerase sigma-70 factor (ECF subfamily)
MGVRGIGEDELEAFFQNSYPRVLGVVSLVTGSRPVAEDAVHEALARAWEHRRPIDHPERWVLTVALNLARNRWRKVRREVAMASAAESDAGAPDPRPLSADLRRALAALPVRQREVVVLHYLLDLPVAEVAALLGLSAGGVKHALFRARASLARALTTEEIP